MKLVYIAGPYRNVNPREIEMNIRRAEDKALEVARAGMVPLVSHSMTRFLYGTLDEAYWLEATAEMLRRCDAMILCEGWSESAGTRGEMKIAIDLGIPIFVSLFGLSTWNQGV